jgi:transposase-like protein
MRKRRIYSPELKAEIVLKVLKEEQSIAQIASEYGLHPNQISIWKKQFIKDAPLLFKNDNKPFAELKAGYEKREDDL